MVNVVCWYYETSFLMMEHLHPNLGQSDKNLFFAFTLENWFNACIFLMHAFVFACCPHITNWLLCEVTLSCSAHPFLTFLFIFLSTPPSDQDPSDPSYSPAQSPPTSPLPSSDEEDEEDGEVERENPRFAKPKDDTPPPPPPSLLPTRPKWQVCLPLSASELLPLCHVASVRICA